MIEGFEYEQKLAQIGVRALEKSMLILIAQIGLTDDDRNTLKDLIQASKELALSGISHSLEQMKKEEFRNN